MPVISHRTVEHDAVGKRLLLGQVSAIYQLDRESVLIVGLAPKRIYDSNGYDDYFTSLRTSLLFLPGRSLTLGSALAGSQ